jgi:hypothetical protein
MHGFFPDLENLGLYAQDSMAAATSFALGVERPEFSLEQPLTPLAAYWLLAGLFQKRTYSATTPGTGTMAKPTNASAQWFSGIQMGQDLTAAVSGVANVCGGVPRKVSISMGAVGAQDGGKCMISADFIAAAIARADSVIAAAGVTDSATPWQTKECVMTHVATAWPFLSANITFENNAVVDPTNVSTPAFVVLGDVTGTGDVTVIFDPATSAWEAMATAQKIAATSTVLTFVFTKGTAILTITLAVLFGKPGAISEQGGVAVQTWPFTVVGSPTVAVAGIGTTDPLATWTIV